MPTRKAIFSNNEFYHIFNRGVDKRKIILDHDDSDRFLKSILFFNSKKPIGSIYEKTFSQNKLSPLGGLTAKSDKLVNIVAYCLNLNNRVHQLGGLTAKLARSSWNEYLNDKKCFSLCAKDIILSQFKNSEEYRRFAESSLKEISRRREEEEISKIILE